MMLACHILLAAAFQILSPGASAPFTPVAPSREAVLEAEQRGARPLVECLELTDERIGFTNYADCAAAVAFARIPRPHLLHSWKAQGVTILKRMTCEASPNRFCRECGFLACAAGADGLWLVQPVPPSHEAALAAARQDAELLSLLDTLATDAARSPLPAVALEARRYRFFLGTVGLDWERLDTLRAECLAWKDRLERLLGRPVTPHPAPAAPSARDALPAAVAPKDARRVRADGTVGMPPACGLAFSYDRHGFTLVCAVTNGPPRGFLDFTLLIGDGHGGLIPYRYHCDLEPMTDGSPRAPARGRGSFLFGTDERFRPYSFAYGAGNSRIRAFPRLADWGPDYPNLRPSFEIKTTEPGRWQAKLSVAWISLYGKWPMADAQTADRWYASVSGPPLVSTDTIEIRWPRRRPDAFGTFAAGISADAIARRYEEELHKAEAPYAVAEAERLYPFATTAMPTFQRGERASDALFLARCVRPLLDRNENLWRAVRSDNGHKPTFDRLSDAAKRQAWRNLRRLLYLSDEVSARRGAYLRDRFAGREPPPYERRDERPSAPDAPDADYDGESISLDEEVF